jgi:23S rRNA (guanosine2251-2'-O)-methyltransferase
LLDNVNSKTAQISAIVTSPKNQAQETCRHSMQDMLNGPMNKRKHHKKSRSASHASGPASPRKKTEPGTWIYGPHACFAALANDKRRCTRFLLTKNAASDIDLENNNWPVNPEIVDRQTIDGHLPDGSVHQGIAVLAYPLNPIDIADVIKEQNDPKPLTLLALDQANDPRNIGAILRTAAAFDVSGIIVPDRGTPEESGALAKAAAGALESIPIVRVTNLVRTLEDLKDDGFWCIGLDGYAEQSISEMDFSGRIVIVLGAEGKGVRRLTRETCDHLCKIPISNTMESLNLSNAAAITLYEISRQSQKKT